MQKKQITKYVFVSIAIWVIIFAIGIFANKSVHNINPLDQGAIAIRTQKEEEIMKQPPKTTLFFVGDMMLTRGVKSSVDKNFGGDYSKLFENLSLLKDADILFANLEGDVSDVGNNVGSKYSFRMDPAILPVIKEAGFDVVSFANNHIGDWNVSAFKDTLSRLDGIGILKTGAGKNKADAENPVIIEKNGTKFGFIGFSDVGPNWMEAKADNHGILLASDPRLGEIIQNAKTKCDVLIVSFHFGVEYKTVHNSRQEGLAHTAIDNGADMIIGHHPHVMEDIEVYKGKTIVYSLGNFIFDQYFSEDTMRGMFFSATFDGKNLVGANQKIITLNKFYQPEGIFDPDEIIEKVVEKKEVTVIPICPIPKNEYEDMSLLNIGQNIPLPDETYIPKNLKELNSISSTRRGVCITTEARDAFQTMVEDALTAGYKIKASSGFRSYAIQKVLFDNASKSGKLDTATSIAKPGYSEHQIGTTVDITGLSVNYSSASLAFNETPESIWLKENSYLYGFIQSYPEGKVDITGYKYEPWHYRFVGIDLAKEIYNSDLTITEYLK
jgi:poly-gamma-glutamate synthesis protein (capsule biosynthesis protein)